MKENDKKIIIRIMNIIALVGNIGTLMLIGIISFLSQYIEEFSEILKNFENGKVSFTAQCLVLGFCIIFSIINLFLSKNLKKNESKISLLMTISMFGSFYNILAGFVSIIVIYKRRKRRNNKWKYKIRRCKVAK